MSCTEISNVLRKLPASRARQDSNCPYHATFKGHCNARAAALSRRRINETIEIAGIGSVDEGDGLTSGSLSRNRDVVGSGNQAVDLAAVKPLGKSEGPLC